LQYAIKNRKLWEDQGQQVLEEMIENMRQKKANGQQANGADETTTTTAAASTTASLRTTRLSI
jgi:hypothetical protein